MSGGKSGLMLIPYKVLISHSSVGNPTLTHCVKFSSPVGLCEILESVLGKGIISNPTFHTKGGDFCFMIEEPITQFSSSLSQIRTVATVQ